MQNPLLFSSNTSRDKRFTSHLTGFQSGRLDLKLGIFDSHGYCTLCRQTSPHHLERVRCSLCERAFHATCLHDKISRNTIATLAKNPSLWWFCLECLYVANSVRNGSHGSTRSLVVNGHGDRPDRSPVDLTRKNARPCARKTLREQGTMERKDARPCARKTLREQGTMEKKFQARLCEMESQIYDRLKSDMEEKLSEISRDISTSRDTSTSRDISLSLTNSSPSSCEFATSTPNTTRMLPDFSFKQDAQEFCEPLDDSASDRYSNNDSNNDSDRYSNNDTLCKMSSSSGFSSGSCNDRHHDLPRNACPRSPPSVRAAPPVITILSPKVGRRKQNTSGLDQIRNLVEMGKKAGKTVSSSAASKTVSGAGRSRIKKK